MTRKLVLAACALGAMFGAFALTGPAHAAAFMCGAFQCEENPGGLYENGTVCSVGSGQTGQADIAYMRSCVEAATGKTAVTMHVNAQGASGRGQTEWNGGLAVTQFEFGSQPLFPESGGILYYEVGRQPATAQDDDSWMLERPHNASFVATTPEPTLDSVIVLAGGGGSKGRIRTSGDGRWPTTGASGGRGGWALGRSYGQTCTTGTQVATCDAGYPGGGDGSSGGGGGGGDLQGGAGGYTVDTANLPSEGGWGELCGPAAYGAQEGRGHYLLVGGEGGAGDGSGGGGGVYYKCGFICDLEDMSAAAGGGGGSRARRTSIQQYLPVFAEEARVELVFNHWSPCQIPSECGP